MCVGDIYYKAFKFVPYNWDNDHEINLDFIPSNISKLYSNS